MAKFCRDCGLAIEDGLQLCEFCLERNKREQARGVRRADKQRKRVPVKSGFRGQGYGWGGQGVTLEEREFFGDAYCVPVPADIAERVERSTVEEDEAVGNTGAEDVPTDADESG